MRIAMIGTGYVGLVSGACFADFGHEVTCVDKDAGKIAALNAGKMPICEPGLDELVGQRRAGRLRFTTDLAGGGRRRRRGVHRRRHAGAARRRPRRPVVCLSPRARAGQGASSRQTVIVTKSTVPVGTGDDVEIIAEEGATEFSVASNPEFLREGAAIQDFKRPDRIVVGAEDEHAREVLREVYRPLFLNEAPLLFTAGGPPS